MKRIALYVAFAAAYLALGLLAAFVEDRFAPGGTLASIVSWTAPFAIAPFAVLVAMQLGRPGHLGLAATSLVLAVAIFLATVGILYAVALPTLHAPAPAYVLHMAANIFTIGGWRLPLSAVPFVAAPMVWSVFLQRRGRLATAAAEATQS
jgi:hypothetical protein